MRPAKRRRAAPPPPQAQPPPLGIADLAEGELRAALASLGGGRQPSRAERDDVYATLGDGAAIAGARARREERLHRRAGVVARPMPCARCDALGPERLGAHLQVPVDTGRAVPWSHLAHSEAAE